MEEANIEAKRSPIRQREAATEAERKRPKEAQWGLMRQREAQWDRDRLTMRQRGRGPMRQRGAQWDQNDEAKVMRPKWWGQSDEAEKMRTKWWGLSEAERGSQWGQEGEAKRGPMSQTEAQWRRERQPMRQRVRGQKRLNEAEIEVANDAEMKRPNKAQTG